MYFIENLVDDKGIVTMKKELTVEKKTRYRYLDHSVDNISRIYLIYVIK